MRDYSGGLFPGAILAQLDHHIRCDMAPAMLAGGQGGDLMSEIEERIRALPGNACRVCAHFIRVNSNDLHNVMNRQGFCILGRLEGDWGLYVSASVSTSCKGFVYSEENARIHDAERQLSDELHEFTHSLYDKRTANYKAVKPLLAAHKEFANSINKGASRMESDLAIRKFASEHFENMHRERFWEVYHMVSLKKSHYLRFLARVSVQVHDEFCECGKIEVVNERYVVN